MRRRHGTGPEPARPAVSSLGNAANSALVMPGCWRGSSWKYHHHMTAQPADTMPSATKEKRQENQGIRKATIGADGRTARLERGPFRERPGRRRQRRALAHPEHTAHRKQRREPGHRPGRDGRHRPSQAADGQRAAGAGAGGTPAANQLERRIGVVERRKGYAERNITE